MKKFFSKLNISFLRQFVLIYKENHLNQLFLNVVKLNIHVNLYYLNIHKSLMKMHHVVENKYQSDKISLYDEYDTKLKNLSDRIYKIMFFRTFNFL